MNKQIVEFLEELVQFRSREVGDMLKIGYARNSIPAYQERTKELKLLIDSLKSQNSENDTNDESQQTQDMADLIKASNEKYLYLLSDFDNYKKRVESEKSLTASVVKEEILTDLLRIVDDIERLLTQCDKAEIKEENASLFVGFRLIYENTIKLLESKGCKKIECSYGDKYDWKWHEAISARKIADDEGYDPGDIVEIYQSGWTIDGKLLRPTKVIVGK